MARSKEQLETIINTNKSTLRFFPMTSGYNSDRAYCYYQIGMAQAELERYMVAITNFRAAIKYYPNYGDAYFQIGRIYLILGNFDQALKNMKASVIAHPDNATYQEALQNIEEKYNKVKNQPKDIVDLDSCNKEELLTLTGFDETKAERFLNLRNKGMKWYNLTTLAKDFELTPYDCIKLANRVKFSTKQANTGKRRIDF